VRMFRDNETQVVLENFKPSAYLRSQIGRG
jgi:hypothetical protein